MSDFQRMGARALSKPEWEELTATMNRSFTDRPVGYFTSGKRSTDALASQAVTEPDVIPHMTRRHELDLTVPQTLPDDPRCGTSAGRTAHWRKRETPCAPCSAAANAERNQRRKVKP